MRAPRVTMQKAALAFAVGSGVYFWYQFAALSAVERQVSTQLASVGLDQLLAPNAQTQAVQRQAPMVAAAAALATLFLV